MTAKINQLNKYEQEMIMNLELEFGGVTYKGVNLLVQIVKGIQSNNYVFYNMVTEGIGANSPIGHLLAKLGIE